MTSESPKRDYLERAKACMEIPEGKTYIPTGSEFRAIAHALIALVERLDKLTTPLGRLAIDDGRP
jgi:hypothetical protein